MVTKQMINELLLQLNEESEAHFLQQIYCILKIHIRRRAK